MDKMNLSVVSVFKMFCSVFSHIRAEYGEIQGISPYSLRMRENTDKKNSKYGHFSSSEHLWRRRVQRMTNTIKRRRYLLQYESNNFNDFTWKTEQAVFNLLSEYWNWANYLKLIIALRKILNKTILYILKESTSRKWHNRSEKSTSYLFQNLVNSLLLLLRSVAGFHPQQCLEQKKKQCANYLQSQIRIYFLRILQYQTCSNVIFCERTWEMLDNNK